MIAPTSRWKALRTLLPTTDKNNEIEVRVSLANFRRAIRQLQRFSESRWLRHVRGEKSNVHFYPRLEFQVAFCNYRAKPREKRGSETKFLRKSEVRLDKNSPTKNCKGKLNTKKKKHGNPFFLFVNRPRRRECFEKWFLIGCREFRRRARARLPAFGYRPRLVRRNVSARGVSAARVYRRTLRISPRARSRYSPFVSPSSLSSLSRFSSIIILLLIATGLESSRARDFVTRLYRNRLCFFFSFSALPRGLLSCIQGCGRSWVKALSESATELASLNLWRTN